MLPITSEIQSDPERCIFVSPAQYCFEVNREYDDAEIVRDKLSKMLFRVACIGKGLHLISYNRPDFSDMCDRVITRYMIDGNVAHMRTMHKDGLGYVLFSVNDFDFYEFSEHKQKWIKGDGDEYDVSIAMNVFKKYNEIIKTLFPLSENKLTSLRYQKPFNPDFIGNADQKIDYYEISYSDIKETLFVLNRLFKSVINSDFDYYDSSLSSKERLYTVFALIDETMTKDIEVAKSVVIKREQRPQAVQMEDRKEADIINGKLRFKIAKIIQAVGACEIQGRLIVLDIESNARSMQVFMLVSMIGIDYYKYRLKKTIIKNKVISDFYYRSEDITKFCYGKLRDPDLKRTLRKKNPELYCQLIESCRVCFPGFEELTNYPPRITRDYAFLKDKSLESQKKS